MIVKPAARFLAPLVLVASLTACSAPGSGGSAESTGAPESNGSTTAAGEEQGVVTIYSGRNETLVEPLLSQIESETGVSVEVRYGGSPELAAQLQEEGPATEADIFFSQDAGALGALAKAERFEPLDASVTDRVYPGYADSEGRWVATSARARVVNYNVASAPEAAEFSSIDDLLQEKYRGKIGIAPANASFQSFVTALRVDRGDEAAKEWLTKLKDLDPGIYDKNSAILTAVEQDEVSLGLINHYYWYERASEEGKDNMKSEIRFLDSDDPGALINVAGVGVLRDSEQKDEAVTVVEYLLSEQAQAYFSEETFEYPVVPEVPAAEGLPPLDSVGQSSVDLNDLDSLPETQQMLEEVGLL